MRVLIIKTSSLGDVIHTLPALTDAGKVFDDIIFDWVVEESFAEVPSWHPLVDRVIPVAFRRWKKTPFGSFFGSEWKSFYHQLRAKSYDYILDAQGLIKSAVLTRLARGFRVGLDKKSLREPFARFAYQKKIAIDSEQHAIKRMRNLFAQALQYKTPSTELEYGIQDYVFPEDNWGHVEYFVFLHGTSWPTKHWPDEYWLRLAKLVAAKGYKIRMPQNNISEEKRVQKIMQNCKAVHMLPRTNLATIASVLKGAAKVISVDTGLAHLTAALGIPNITLYGPTNPSYIGTVGENQQHAVSDFECIFCGQKKCTYTPIKNVYPACFENLTPSKIGVKIGV